MVRILGDLSKYLNLLGALNRWFILTLSGKHVPDVNATLCAQNPPLRRGFLGNAEIISQVVEGQTETNL